MPPLSTTASAPTSTNETLSMTCATAESSTIVTGMPYESRARAMATPESSGRPSVTKAVNCVPLAAAARSSASTTRERPCTKTAPPLSKKRSPSSAIRARAFTLVCANACPLSTRSALTRSSSVPDPVVRVTYRMNRSHAALSGTVRVLVCAAKFCIACTASLSSMCSAIIVLACECSMQCVKEAIAATATGRSVSPSPARKTSITPTLLWLWDAEPASPSSTPLADL
mmetsp:Transcript_1429/g.5267  ORF Transcript_1429/g.5267 Transcript_1429/m.5267 type:complete len:228 (+) Transcript_1429:1782-2465(+)